MGNGGRHPTAVVVVVVVAAAAAAAQFDVERHEQAELLRAPEVGPHEERPQPHAPVIVILGEEMRIAVGLQHVAEDPPQVFLDVQVAGRGVARRALQVVQGQVLRGGRRWRGPRGGGRLEPARVPQKASGGHDGVAPGPREHRRGLRAIRYPAVEDDGQFGRGRDLSPQLPIGSAAVLVLSVAAVHRDVIHAGRLQPTDERDRFVEAALE